MNAILYKNPKMPKYGIVKNSMGSWTIYKVSYVGGFKHRYGFIHKATKKEAKQAFKEYFNKRYEYLQIKKEI